MSRFPTPGRTPRPRPVPRPTAGPTPGPTPSPTPSPISTTFTLTTNADGPNAIPPAVNTQGGQNISIYNGNINSGIGNQDLGTVNSFDNYAGTAGFANVLNARITTSTGGTIIAPQGTNIATINLTNITSTAATAGLNLASITGVQNVNFVNSVATGQTAAVNAPATASVALDNADGDSRINFLGAASRTGTTDAFRLTVANGTGAATAFAPFRITTGDAATPDTSFEVANITVGPGSENFVNIATGGANLTTVNVSGAGTPGATGVVLNLTEAANFANLTTVSASGLTTGGLDIATTLQQNVTFTGSAFNDRLLVTAGVNNLTSLDSINFGAGTNTLAFGTTDDFRAATIPNQVALINGITTAQVLESTNNGATQIRAADFTTINSFVLSTARTNQVALTGLASNDSVAFASNIQVTAGGNGADGTAGNTGTTGANGLDAVLAGGVAVAQTPTFVLAGGVTIQGAAGGNGGAGGAAAANNAGLAGGAAGAGADGLDITNGGTNITTLTINSIGTAANVIRGGAGGNGGAGSAANGGNNNGGAGGAAGASGAGINNGAGLQNVVITGTQNLTIAGAAAGNGGAGGALSGTGTAGVNGAAGAATGGFANAVNLNASAFTGQLTATGSSAADVITGGSAVDALTTFGGLDRLTGNGSNDNFRINGAAATTATAFVTVTDFNPAGDTLSILSRVANAGALNGTPNFNTTKVNVTSAATLAQALNLAAAGDGSTTSQITYFNFAGDTYLVVDNTNTATLAATDGVIQLLGNLTLTANNVNFV